MLRGPLGRFRSGRRAPSQRGELLRGGPVEVSVLLRRTSARGWGPWTAATVRLEALPDGEVSWHAEDPVAVGFPAIGGPVDLLFTEVTDVYLRAVRFRSEAFWGMDADIVVVAADVGTIELSLTGEDVRPLADRLAAQLLH